MITPVRLHLSRRKGFNLQEHSRAVNGLEAKGVVRPSNLGNPFGYWMGKGPDEFGAAFEVQLFRRWLSGEMTETELFERLAGEVEKARALSTIKSLMALRLHLLSNMGALANLNLACWCRLCATHAKGKPIGVLCEECPPCHADIYLDLANRPCGDSGQ